MPGYFTQVRRRRLASLCLFAGIFVIFKLASKDAPREQEVQLLLDGAQREARTLRLAYRMQGEEITGLLVRYPEGAPARVSHTPELSPGTYDLAIELGYRDGRVEHVAKTLTVPSEEAIRVRLP
jgi:hypothetical protein